MLTLSWLIVAAFLFAVFWNRIFHNRAMGSVAGFLAWTSWLGIVALLLFAVVVLPLPFSRMERGTINVRSILFSDDEYLYFTSNDAHGIECRRLIDGQVTDTLQLPESNFIRTLSGFADNGKTVVLTLRGDPYHEAYHVVACEHGKPVKHLIPFPGENRNGSVYYSAAKKQFVAFCVEDFSKRALFQTYDEQLSPVGAADTFFLRENDFLYRPEFIMECEGRLLGATSNNIMELMFDGDSMRVKPLELERGQYMMPGFTVYHESSDTSYYFSCSGISQDTFPPNVQPFRSRYHMFSNNFYAGIVKEKNGWREQGYYYHQDRDHTDTIPDVMYFMRSGTLEIFPHFGSRWMPHFGTDFKLKGKDGAIVHFHLGDDYDDFYFDRNDTLFIYNHIFSEYARFDLKSGHRLDFPGMDAVLVRNFESGWKNHSFRCFLAWTGLLLWPLLLIVYFFSRKNEETFWTFQRTAWTYAFFGISALGMMIVLYWF